MDTALILPHLFWNIVIINDGKTNPDFVILCLMEFFNKNKKDADELVNQFKISKKIIAGTYVRDIADTKRELICDYCRSLNHHLQILIEKK